MRFGEISGVFGLESRRSEAFRGFFFRRLFVEVVRPEAAERRGERAQHDAAGEAGDAPGRQAEALDASERAREPSDPLAAQLTVAVPKGVAATKDLSCACRP